MIGLKKFREALTANQGLISRMLFPALVLVSLYLLCVLIGLLNRLSPLLSAHRNYAG